MKKVKHNEWRHEQLKDPGFSAEYLTAAAEDDEPAVFLQALRKVAETQGMAAVAKRAGLPRESLYRVLSAKGNPRWSTLAPVVCATGLKIEVIRQREPMRIATPWKPCAEPYRPLLNQRLPRCRSMRARKTGSRAHKAALRTG